MTEKRVGMEEEPVATRMRTSSLLKFQSTAKIKRSLYMRRQSEPEAGHFGGTGPVFYKRKNKTTVFSPLHSMPVVFSKDKEYCDVIFVKGQSNYPQILLSSTVRFRCNNQEEDTGFIYL